MKRILILFSLLTFCLFGTTFAQSDTSVTYITVSKAGRSYPVVYTGGGSTVITSLNGSTNATQSFAVSSGGTDVGITTSSGVHTFTVPIASATAAGKVTTSAQTFGGRKTFNAGANIGGSTVTYGRGSTTTLSQLVWDGLTSLHSDGFVVGTESGNGYAMMVQQASNGSTANGLLVSTRNDAAYLLCLRDSNATSLNRIIVDGLGSITSVCTGYWQLPSGTTAQQPGSPATAMTRYNSTKSSMEFYGGGDWNNILSRPTASTTSGALFFSNGTNANEDATNLSYSTVSNELTVKELTTNGRRKVAFTTVTASVSATATLDDTNDLVYCNPNTTDITISLPLASTCSKCEYRIGHIGSANAVIIDPAGSELIDGATTKTIGTIKQFLTINCDGTAWYITAKN